MIDQIAQCRNCILCTNNPQCCNPFGVKKTAPALFVTYQVSYVDMLAGQPTDLYYQLIKKIMKNIGEFAYTSLLKCQGDAKGKKSKTYVTECKKWLDIELQHSQTKVIYALGTEVAQHLLGYNTSLKIGDICGKIHYYNGIKTVPLYGIPYMLNCGRKLLDQAIDIIKNTYAT